LPGSPRRRAAASHLYLEPFMKTVALKMLCRLLVVALMALPMHPALAGMIGTDAALAAASTQADRDAITGALNRSDVARQLQSQGVDPEAVKLRVAAMTDAEAHALAGQIAAAPAGADSGWIIVALVIAALVWIVYAYR
jgi:hypothetical protein